MKFYLTLYVQRGRRGQCKIDQIIDRKYFPQINNSLCPTRLARSKRLNGRRAEEVTIESSSSF